MFEFQLHRNGPVSVRSTVFVLHLIDFGSSAKEAPHEVFGMCAEIYYHWPAIDPKQSAVLTT